MKYNFNEIQLLRKPIGDQPWSVPDASFLCNDFYALDNGCYWVSSSKRILPVGMMKACKYILFWGFEIWAWMGIVSIPVALFLRHIRVNCNKVILEVERRRMLGIVQSYIPQQTVVQEPPKPQYPYACIMVRKSGAYPAIVQEGDTIQTIWKRLFPDDVIYDYEFYSDERRQLWYSDVPQPGEAIRLRNR